MINYSGLKSTRNSLIYFLKIFIYYNYLLKNNNEKAQLFVEGIKSKVWMISNPS